MSITVTESALLPVRRDKQSISSAMIIGGGAGSGSSSASASSQFTTAEYTELHEWLDNVTLGNDGSTTLAGTTITPILKVTTGAAAGNILVSAADGTLGYLAAGATTKILVGGGAANPVWTTATGTGAPVRADSPVFTTQVTLPALTLIPDGGSIGQAAGPLLTFDDTHNYLEITGCSVGIGTTPATLLEIKHPTSDTAVRISTITAEQARLEFAEVGSTGWSIGERGGDDYFYISNSLGNLATTPRLVIDTNGSVGFGTTNPNYKLEVNTEHAVNIDDEIALGSYYEGNLYGLGLNYRIDGAGNPSRHLVTHSGGVRTTVMSFVGSNVGIGFTTPLSALCINGGLHVGGESAAGDNNLLVDGTAEITGVTTLTGYTKTVGGVHVGGAADPGADNLWVDGISQHPDWVTGWFGNNWRIAENGDIEVENLLVRASARFRELIIDQLSIIAGSNLMSIARGKIESIDVPNSKVTLEDPNNRDACSFAVNDFFWIKAIDIEGTLFSDCRGQVTAVVGTTLTLSFAVAGANGAIGDIAEGDVIVQRGNSTEADRQALIYTTVSDADGPFERVMTGVDSLAAFNDLDNVVWQSGNLVSLDSHDIVPADPGYGLYSNNVYLSGTIHSADGEIGGWTIDTDAIYTGSKHVTDGYGTSGITFADTGGIHSPTFYIDDDGDIGIRAKEVIYAYIISDDVIISHDSVETSTSDVMAELKTITLGAYIQPGRTLRIKFDMQGVTGENGYGRIYRNGGAVGTLQSVVGLAYETFSEDITDWDPTDTVELWTASEFNGHNTSVRNFRICGDHAVVTNEVTGTTS